MATYEELAGSPAYEFTSTGAISRRRFRVSAANVDAFKLELFGGNIGGKGISHPVYSTLRVSDVSVRPQTTKITSTDCPRNTLATDSANTYAHYIVDVTYEAEAVMDSAANDSILVLTGDEVSLEYSVRGGVEMITIPGRDLYWDVGAMRPIETDTVIGIRVPVLRHTYAYSNVPRSAIPFGDLRDYSGCVNSAALYLNDYLYQAGQVLFDGYDLSAQTPTGSSQSASSRWRVTYTFLTRSSQMAYETPDTTTSTGGPIMTTTAAGWNKIITPIKDTDGDYGWSQLLYVDRDDNTLLFEPYEERNLADLAIDPTP